jgi:hypothetical protein
MQQTIFFRLLNCSGCNNYYHYNKRAGRAAAAIDFIAAAIDFIAAAIDFIAAAIA